MINQEQLRDLIRNTLSQYGLHSQEAEDLIYGTIAHESKRGTYLKQKPKGTFNYEVHALGIPQMEYATFCWLADKYGKLYGFSKSDFLRMEYDLKLGILLCRLRYRAVPHPIPTELEEMAKYYKKYYNTSFGSATPEDFIEAFLKN